MTTTINNLAIENKGNAIQIIESFGLSSKRIETIYFVMRVGKDAYTFVSADDAADFDKENHKNEVFGSQEAAAEAAHNLAVETVEQLETAFEIGYTEIAQNSTSTTTKLNQSAPIFYKGNIVSLIDWDSLTDAGLLYIKVKKAKFVAHVSELSNLDTPPAPEADQQETIYNNSDHPRRIAGETPETAVKHFKKHHRPAGVSRIASLERVRKNCKMKIKSTLGFAAQTPVGQIAASQFSAIPSVDTLGIVTGLPAPQWGVLFLVNARVFGASDRKDLVQFDPDQTIRNPDGTAAGQGGFVRKDGSFFTFSSEMI